MRVSVFVVAVSWAAAQDTENPRIRELDAKYERIKAHPCWKAEGAQEVLKVAWETLREGYRRGEWSLVGLEDLVVESLQEGRGLFENPKKRWGPTSAEETKDYLGQTTIGPWQITTTNIRKRFGLKYGVKEEWSDAEVAVWCARRPGIQAAMISDYIQDAYERYGRRGPYAIQSYFWLEGYCTGKIGGGAWDESVLKRPMQESGFYAKQIVCGHRHQPYGLLYWLAYTGATEEVKELLRRWKEEHRRQWVVDDRDLPHRGRAEATDEPGNFGLAPDDLKYVPDEAIRARLAELLK